MSARLPGDEQLYLAMLEDHRLFVPALGGWLERHEACHVACSPGLSIELLNGIWVDAVGGDAAVPAFEGHLDRVRDAGGTAFVSTMGPASEAVRAEVHRLGLTTVESPPMMAVTADGFTGLPETAASLRPVTEPTEVAALLASGYGMSAEQASLLANDTFLGLDGTEMYIASVQDVPVSTATTIHIGEGVGVYGVATPPEHRRHGYGAAVTAAAVAAAFDRGARYAYLQASEMGEPVYQRLGFEERFRFTVFYEPSV